MHHRSVADKIIALWIECPESETNNSGLAKFMQQLNKEQRHALAMT